MGKAEDKSDKTPNDFIVGLVTFIMFMTVWMYVGTSE